MNLVKCAFGLGGTVCGLPLGLGADTSRGLPETVPAEGWGYYFMPNHSGVISLLTYLSKKRVPDLVQWT